MFSNKRLTKVFNSAIEIPFDETSKFILFSDCHRGNNSLADSKHKGVGGMMKPTLKQKMVAEQIKSAEERLDRMTRLLEKQYK